VTPTTSRTAPTGRKRRPYAARVPAGERRTQLLDAALRVIVRDGYDAVSVDAVAREAGVTRPVVYGVFSGLGELLSALLDRQQERALAQLAAALPAKGMTDPDAALLDSARRMIEQVRSDPLTWQPILLAPVGTPDVVRARIDADRRNLVTQLAGLLELGLAVRGGPDLDPEVFAHAILAVLEHFGRLLLAEPDLFDTDRLVAAVEVLLRALR
jgi:AcrR family transcriptional regulator